MGRLSNVSLVRGDPSATARLYGLCSSLSDSQIERYHRAKISTAKIPNDAVKAGPRSEEDVSYLRSKYWVIALMRTALCNLFNRNQVKLLILVALFSGCQHQKAATGPSITFTRVPETTQ